ncbi:MAG TPA: family 1 glycosylhydrolase [Myxococcales bacterium]|nr:family 1 glycosylhydrolase [Myxococcales bacterium]
MAPPRTASVFAALLVSCTSAPRSVSITFPKGFLWSVSTAAEQSEGNNTTNDWYAFEGMGRVPPVGLADDMYDLYDEDFATARSMGCNAFRLTLEWARFFPKAPADPAHPTAAEMDQTAVAHYQAVLASLQKHGLTPLVTLTHYTLPVWVDNPAAYDGGVNAFTDSSLGGWTNPATAVAFGAFAGLMAQTYGTQVTYWLTENEPEVDVIGGYLAGVLPPGLSDISLTEPSLPGDAGISGVIQNMIAGHADAYHAIKAAEPNAMVSIAHNTIAFDPITQNTGNVEAAQRVQALYDHLYLDAVTTGVYDTGLVGAGDAGVAHADWAQTLDYIGVNYYNHDAVVAQDGFLAPLNAVPCDPSFEQGLPGVLQNLGCPAQGLPEAPGFTAVLVDYAQRYGLPILVTENGGGGASGTGKAAYLVQNLLALHEALDAGVNVIGYSYWTLNRDYEWASGYDQSYGLYDVAGFKGPDGGLPPGSDGGPWAPSASTDETRVPLSPAPGVYAAIIDGGLTPALLAEYPPDGG